MGFVAVDLGASATRFCSNNGYISVLPNNLVYLPSMADSDIQTDSADIESNLEVKIEKLEEDATAQYFPANVLMGIMAEKHRQLDERPSVNGHKHTQRINYISAVVAVAVSKIKSNLEGPINLYLATPPIEVKTAGEEFKKHLVGHYIVTFPKFNGGTRVEFEISDVHCSEEALMASTSFFFNQNGSPREDHKKYLAGTILSLDIGASTTDMAIVKNGRYLDKSGQTYRIGGNVARDYLLNAICERYAVELPVENAERTMAEGRIQLGNSYGDVTDIVAESKRALATQIVQHLETYFKRVGVPIQTINAIVTCGGGSLASQYVDDNGEIVKTSEPMSYYVTEALQQWSFGTDVVPYGEEARFANIKGLFIKAMYAEAKAQVQAKEQAENT